MYLEPLKKLEPKRLIGRISLPPPRLLHEISSLYTKIPFAEELNTNPYLHMSSAHAAISHQIIQITSLIKRLRRNTHPQLSLPLLTLQPQSLNRIPQPLLLLPENLQPHRLLLIASPTPAFVQAQLPTLLATQFRGFGCLG